MTSPTLTYDREANALYIRFSDNEITRTLELSVSVYVDVDADGNPVGFEILNAEPGLLGSLPVKPDTATLCDLLTNKAA